MLIIKLQNSKTKLHLFLTKQGEDQYLTKWAFFVAATTVSLFLVNSALFSGKVPFDIAMLAVVLLVVMIAYFLKQRQQPFNYIEKMCAYVACAISIFLTQTSDAAIGELHVFYYALFVLLALSFIVGIRFSKGRRFGITTLDFLVLFIALFAANIIGSDYIGDSFGVSVAMLIVLFYGVELIVTKLTVRSDIFRLVLFAAFAVIGFRGLL